MPAGNPPGADVPAAEVNSVEAEFTVINEFTAVRISKIRTPNGHRVEIRSLRLGHRVRLDPLALESISWQSPDVFSTFLDQPFGPGAGPSLR
ncbi:hypothetical protein [Streptomyces uncialis]|uniref:hypothetical protein n=1 Tax=Streptomyces uncialis TaxID=1048205 RepID=UPI00340AFDE2